MDFEQHDREETGPVVNYIQYDREQAGPIEYNGNILFVVHGWYIPGVIKPVKIMKYIFINRRSFT